MINKSLPKTEDPEYLNLKEREFVFHYLKALVFLPAELVQLGLSVLESHVEATLSAVSAQIVVQFKADLLAELDPRGTPGHFTHDVVLELLCLSSEVCK